MSSRGWGATRLEGDLALPGDHLVPNADYRVTRAVTVRTGPDLAWPWIAQLGQQGGGFYSYDALENLVGCRIHSADRIHPEWQDPAVGDQVRLFPDDGLTIAELQPGRAMVLHGGMAPGRRPPPFDFSWAFVLLDGPARGCRLLVRERYSYERHWAPFLVRPTAVVSAVMTRRMLLGIKSRAEQSAAAPPSTTRPQPMAKP
jgi:hypothetical protein